MSTGTFQGIYFVIKREQIINFLLYAHVRRIVITFVAQKVLQAFGNIRSNMKQEKSVFETTFGVCAISSRIMLPFVSLIKHSLRLILFTDF